MKKILIFTVSMMVAVGAFAQGSVRFQNRIPAGTVGSPQGPVVALLYGVNPGNPNLELHGNSATGIPVGSTDYTGHPLLAGTGFTVQLWGGLTAGSMTLAQNGSTVFRTGTGAGILVELASAAIINGAPPGSGSRAVLEVRAWDNASGALTTWQQVLDRDSNIGGPPVGHGTSGTFTPNFDLGGGPVLPPNLIGLTSFNLHIIPEPSSIALGVLGLGTLMFLRRRK